MAFLIVAIICVCSLACTLFWEIRFNTHMFQLNGYKNNEQMVWTKKNVSAQITLPLFAFLCIVNLFYCNFVTLLIIAVFSIAEMLYYISLKNKKSKKKLVYTNRVKRLLTTNIILDILIPVICYLLGGWNLGVAALCCLAFVEPLLIVFCNIVNSPMEKGINRYYINDAKKKLQSNRNIKVIGITGSYGKTSVKFYLQTLLSAQFNVLITPESYNTPMGVVKTIRGSLKPTHEVFVCEMGARYVGDIKEICDIVHPHWGVITSVGPQHLETFGNIDNIIDTKFELADAVHENGKIILNGDNEYIRQKSKKYKNIVFYNSKMSKGEYYAKDVSLSSFGTQFVVVTPQSEEELFQTHLIGEHNLINILSAITVANLMGVPLRELIIPVRKLKPVEHRMQMIKRGNTTIIDDAYNSNPVGSKAAIRTLSMLDGLKVLVTPGMVELGDEEYNYNYKLGEYAAEYCDYIILVGKRHTKPILEGVSRKGFPAERCKIFESITEAVNYAYSIPTDKHKYILLENDLPDNY